MISKFECTIYLIFAGLIVLKLCGYISISWWLVFSPLIILGAIGLSILVIGTIDMLFKKYVYNEL